MSTLHAVRPRRDSRAASEHAALALRLRVYATRGRLDRQLTAGRPCESTPQLALRARQLTDPCTRQEVARHLREIVDYADRRTSQPVISALVIEPAAVRRARNPTLGLAERLEAPVPASPAGVAGAVVLITDGLSPLFNRNAAQTVSEAVSKIEDALERIGDDQ